MAECGWFGGGARLCHNPSPPGLVGYWTLECLWGGGGGAYHAPLLLSREPLFVESRARRHSKALDKTLQNHLSELKIEVTCKVKVRSNVKIRRFDVLGPGDQDYRTWWLKLRHNVVKGMFKVWYEYKWAYQEQFKVNVRSQKVTICKNCD